jgi:hypothetical protein
MYLTHFCVICSSSVDFGLRTAAHNCKSLNAWYVDCHICYVKVDSKIFFRSN